VQSLSPAVRDRLPRIAVSVHSYAADPAVRMARVNGQVLREGDALDEGLQVEAITPQGIVFRFQGQAFHLRATEGWRGR
jgi:general secretion pathway protein B